MIHYKGRTFCASPGCKGKCGRNMTAQEHAEVKRTRSLVAWGFFCDENGEPKFEKSDPQPPPMPSKEPR